MAFARRKIDLTFQLGTGAFGDSGFNTVKVSGLRVQAHITKAGGASMGSLDMRVYGLTPMIMNSLSSLTTQIMMQRKNSVILSAGDDVSGMCVIFEGTIADGWVDLNSSPDSALQIKAFSGLIQALEPAPASSYPGSADAAVIMASLATQMGLKFENNGVSVILSTPYFPGTARDQAMECADAANINWFIDDTTLAIWPKGGSRGGAIPIVSAGTGMIGFPAHNGTGIAVQTLFNPTISYGNTVQVQSVIPNACGNWFVCALYHELESETPNGQWATHFQGAPLYNVNVIPQ
jgi:hypothetical protein